MQNQVRLDELFKMASSDLLLRPILAFIFHEPCLSFPILEASFWMQDDFVKVWNIAGIKINNKKCESARFLTNNALEGYNRHFNGIVPSSHPNLVVFAHALESKAK